MRGILTLGAVSLALALAGCGAGELADLRSAQHDLTTRIASLRKSGLTDADERLQQLSKELGEVERKIAAKGEKP